MTESINKNYYIALYQAIIQKDAIKTAKLDELNDKEKENYPNEFPEVDYDAIFVDNDPDDFTEELIKSDAEFYKECLVAQKAIFANYYIAYYQYLSISSVDKIKELTDIISIEEKMNYPNEFPEVDYDAIFADSDFVDVVLGMLKTQDGKFREFICDLSNPLANDETIAKRKKLLEELKQYPLIKYCPNAYFGADIIDSLASVTYSKIFNYQQFKHSVEPSLSKSIVLKDCFASVALTPLADNAPTIALVGEDITEFNPTRSKNVGGYHHSLINQLVVTNSNGKIHLPFMAHEFAHKLMDLLFDNNSNPYPKDDAEIKLKYHRAIKEVLLNIKEFIKNEFGIDFKLDDNETTWDIGKKLCTILFPEAIQGDELIIKGLVGILQENNLNINQSVSWLRNSYLEEVAYTLKFETADLMIKNGFELKHNILITAVAGGHKQLLDWYLEQENIDPNFQNQFGNSAIDWSEDAQITKLLISAGAEIYSSKYFEKICSVNDNFVGKKELPSSLKNNLEAIKWFLVLYLQSDSYDQAEEDCEFIVRLPQVIAEGLYEDKVINILAPLNQYWEDVVSPRATAFQNEHETDGICLPLPGEITHLIDLYSN